MIVVLVNQDNLKIRLAQHGRHFQATETATYDNHSLLFVSFNIKAHNICMCWCVFSKRDDNESNLSLLQSYTIIMKNFGKANKSVK